MYNFPLTTRLFLSLEIFLEAGGHQAVFHTWFQFMIETSTPKRTRLIQPRRVNSCLCKISPFHRLALHRTKRHPFAALILLQRLKARLRQLMPMQNYHISLLMLSIERNYIHPSCSAFAALILFKGSKLAFHLLVIHPDIDCLYQLL